MEYENANGKLWRAQLIAQRRTIWTETNELNMRLCASNNACATIYQLIVVGQAYNLPKNRNFSGEFFTTSRKCKMVKENKKIVSMNSRKATNHPAKLSLNSLAASSYAMQMNTKCWRTIIVAGIFVNAWCWFEYRTDAARISCFVTNSFSMVGIGGAVPPQRKIL